MVAPANTLSRAAQLQQAHNNAARLRCEAFVNSEDTVCGIRLKPVTLDTFNALDAFQNGFFHGGPVTFQDVANFIWLHHPEFGQFARREKRRVMRHVWRWLNPRFPRLNGLVWFASQLPRFRWMRHFRRERSVDLVRDTVAQIRAIMKEATVEMPRGNNEGEPSPYAFQAHLLNTFRRNLAMSFAETRSLPMKQLAEHYREIIHTNSRGKILLLTQVEEDIFADDMKAKTDALPKTPGKAGEKRA